MKSLRELPGLIKDKILHRKPNPEDQALQQQMNDRLRVERIRLDKQALDRTIQREREESTQLGSPNSEATQLGQAPAENTQLKPDLTPQKIEEIRINLEKIDQDIRLKKIEMDDPDARNPQTRDIDARVLKELNEARANLESQLPPKPKHTVSPQRQRLSDYFRDPQPSTTSKPPTPDKPTGNS